MIINLFSKIALISSFGKAVSPNGIDDTRICQKIKIELIRQNFQEIQA
jgi:hypothetical protein